MNATCMVFEIFQKDRKTRTFRKQDTFWQIPIHCVLLVCFFHYRKKAEQHV